LSLDQSGPYFEAIVGGKCSCNSSQMYKYPICPQLTHTLKCAAFALSHYFYQKGRMTPWDENVLDDS